MQQNDNARWEKDPLDPTCFIRRMNKPLPKNSIVMIRTLQGDSPEPGWTLAWTHDDAPFDKHTDLKKIADEADFFVGVTTLQRVFAVEAEHGFRTCYYKGYEEEAIRADSIIYGPLNHCMETVRTDDGRAYKTLPYRVLAELQYIFALDMCGEPDETYAPGEPLATFEQKRKRDEKEKGDKADEPPPNKKQKTTTTTTTTKKKKKSSPSAKEKGNNLKKSQTVSS
jgi:hypothetical protein